MIRSKAVLNTFFHLSDLLRKHKRVFFSRFGDGDIFIMDGKDQQNHHCSPELQKEMLEAVRIEHPLYLKAVGANHPREKFMSRGCFAPFSINSYLVEVLERVLGEECTEPFENAVVFHYTTAFSSGLMNDFLDEFIRNKAILYIGGLEKEIIEKVTGPKLDTVKTPMKDAYHCIESWWPEVLDKLDDAEVIIPSAGMASRVINKRLWNMGMEKHSIDIGSLFDALSGKRTRSWIRLLGHRMESVVLPEYKSYSLTRSLKHAALDARYFIRTLYR
ncbi:MAG: hypothetical protein ACLFVE_03600 [Chitinispirillaceae bacterium]